MATTHKIKTMMLQVLIVLPAFLLLHSPVRGSKRQFEPTETQQCATTQKSGPSSCKVQPSELTQKNDSEKMLFLLYRIGSLNISKDEIITKLRIIFSNKQTQQEDQINFHICGKTEYFNPTEGDTKNDYALFKTVLQNRLTTMQSDSLDLSIQLLNLFLDPDLFDNLPDLGMNNPTLRSNTSKLKKTCCYSFEDFFKVQDSNMILMNLQKSTATNKSPSATLSIYCLEYMNEVSIDLTSLPATNNNDPSSIHYQIATTLLGIRSYETFLKSFATLFDRINICLNLFGVVHILFGCPEDDVYFLLSIFDTHQHLSDESYTKEHVQSTSNTNQYRHLLLTKVQASINATQEQKSHEKDLQKIIISLLAPILQEDTSYKTFLPTQSKTFLRKKKQFVLKNKK